MERPLLHPNSENYEHVQWRINKLEAEIDQLKYRNKNFGKIIFNYYNTADDPQYVEACQRALEDKLKEKVKASKLKVLEIKWQKYNKFEQSLLVIIEIVYNIAFLKDFIHPVVFEDHWVFSWFKKIT